MPTLSTTKATATVAGVANAVFVVLLAFGVLDLTDAQLALVLVVVNTSVGLALAIWAHLRPSTVDQPVAIAIALPLWSSAVLQLFLGLHWWMLTDAKASAVQALVLVIVGVPSGLWAYDKVNTRQTLEVAEARAATPAAIEAGIAARAVRAGAVAALPVEL